MEFACSHVVCNWKPEGAAVQRHRSTLDSPVTEERPSISRPLSSSDHDYDNRVAVLPKPDISIVPPPLPPRQSLLHKQPQPKSAPPPVPPRGQEAKGEMRLKANVNVLSLNVGRLVDISKAAAIHCTRRPVYCSRCHAAMSSLSNLQSKQSETVWPCEFCGQENKIMSTDPGAKRTARQNLPGRDIIYLSEDSDGDYINLEDMLVVFCVDISGSMSVTYEVTPGNSTRSPTYVSRLQSVQDALQRALSSLLHSSPHRRVALVTFNDEVTVYGDGTGAPLTLRDWSLVDFDHLKEQGKQYCTPHCIAESIHPLNQKIKEMQEHGATALGPAALVSIAMASRYTGSKVIICTDGQANIGLGAFEQGSEHAVSYCPYFYSQLAKEAVDKGVIVSVLTFEGTDCRLAEVGRLADYTGGRVNIVNISSVSTEIQSVLADSIMATDVTATLLSAEGVYFPYEDEVAHKLVRKLGNVTEGAEVTFQFAVKPENVETFQRKDRVPFQLQLDFKTRDMQRVTRIVTEQRRVTTSSWVWAGSLNMAVLGVHCAQLCARLTMEGRVLEAQKQLKAQQDLLKDISEQRPGPKEESIYGNWISTMSMICEDLSVDSQDLSDEAAKVVYQMKRARSVGTRRPKEGAQGL